MEPESVTEFWLVFFSEEGRWRDGLPDDVASEILCKVDDDAVEDVVRELEANDLPADSGKLENLLRHWVRIELFEQPITEDRESRKRDRNAAKELQKHLQRLDDLIAKQGLPSAYSISQHLNHPFRVHRSLHLLESFRSVVREFRPAIDGLAAAKLKRGVAMNLQLQVSIETLSEIYEFVTGAKASRIVEPIDGIDGGPFRAFVERCLRMLGPDDKRPIDHTIRSVIDARRVAREIPQHTDVTKRHAGLGDDS